MVKSDLYEQFDITQNYVLDVISNDDKQFFLMQQQQTSSSSMSGIDKALNMKENRKRLRFDRAKAFEEKCALSIVKHTEISDCTSAAVDGSSSSSSSESDNDLEFQAPLSCKCCVKRSMQSVLTKVTTSLDRVNLPDR